jgi:hypothetical protein
MDLKLVNFIDAQLDFICDSNHVLNTDIHTYAETLFKSFSFLEARVFSNEYDPSGIEHQEDTELFRKDEFVGLFISMLILRQAGKGGQGSLKAREQREIEELQRQRIYYEHIYPKG